MGEDVRGEYVQGGCPTPGDSGPPQRPTDASSYRVNVDNATSCDTLSAVFDKYAPTDPRVYVTYVRLLVYFADAQATTAIIFVVTHNASDYRANGQTDQVSVFDQ